MNLTLRDIEYFVAMVEHGSFARAASALGVTQPALSKALKRVEADTGLALFHRDSRPLQLTSAGLTFLQHAKRLNAEYAGAVRNVTELRTGNAGLLRIGATGATRDTLVLPTLASMFPHRPAMRVQLHVDLSDSLVRSVEEGTLDLAVVPTYDAVDPLSHVPVGVDELHVVTSAPGLPDRGTPVPVGELCRHRWILPTPSSRARALLDAGFAHIGMPRPDAALELDFISHGAMELAAANGFLIAIPGDSLRRASELGLRPIRLDPRMQVQLRRSRSLVGRDMATWSPLMHEFAQRLQQDHG